MEFSQITADILKRYINKYSFQFNTDFKMDISPETFKNEFCKLLLPEITQGVYNIFNNYRKERNPQEDKNLRNFYRELVKESDLEWFVQIFPELDRFIKLRASFFHNYIKKILLDLEVYGSEVGFERLNSIEFSLGDSHQDGKQVCLIVLDEKKYIYKPRDAKINKKFNKLVSEYIEEYGYYIYSTDQFSIHEFIEFSQPKSDKERKKYFYNIGILTAIFYFLNSTDMHYENLIVSNTIPQFIDLETVVDIHSDNLIEELKSFKDAIDFSVLNSMIYPAPFQENGLDISALTAKKGTVKNFNYKAKQLQDSNNDNVHFVEVNIATEAQKNNIIQREEIVHPIEYMSSIEEGFMAFSYLVLDKKEQIKTKFLELIQGMFIRQVIRPTHVYGKFISASLESYYIQDYFNREKLFEIFHNEKAASKKEPQIKYEIENMLKGDVPVFYAKENSYHLYSSKEKILQHNYFEVTCADVIKKKIDEYSEEEAMWQLQLMRNSLLVSALSDESKPNLLMQDFYIEKGINEEPLNELENIKMGLKNVNSELIGFIPFFDGKTYKLWLQNLSVYETGFILLLYYKRKELKLEPSFFRKYVKSSYDLGSNIDDHIDVFYGLGSSLYFLFTLYQSDKWEYYSDKISNLIEEIRKRIEEPREIEFDFMTGLAGVLTVATNILIYCRENGEDKFVSGLRKLVGHCQNIFIHHREYINEEYRAGFGHGLAGIYFSLLMSNKVIQNSNVSRISLEFLEKEEEEYVEKENNFLDPRNEGLDTYYYCYGIVGILLARVKLYKNGLISKKNIEHKLHQLIERILNKDLDFKKMNYSLCHGLGSIIELMLEVKSSSLVNENKIDKVISILFIELYSNDKNGIKGSFAIPNFMNGTTGKLYCQLREKDETPSILTFELGENYEKSTLCSTDARN